MTFIAQVGLMIPLRDTIHLRHPCVYREADGIPTPLTDYCDKHSLILLPRPTSQQAGLIDHSVLLEAKESCRVAGVAFDVDLPSSTSDSWKKLVNHDNVIVTPHIGALTTEAREKVSRGLACKVNDALEGNSFKGVLNAPNIDFGKRGEIEPLLSLAEKLGSMQAKLLGISRLKRVLVIAEGPRVTSSELSSQLMNGVLKVLPSHLLEEEVTFAHAKQLADIMGIRTENETSKTITPTVFGKDQFRFVSFDGVPMDAIPSKYMLLFNNTDRPGVLHKANSVLAKHEISIKCFDLARENFGTAAVGVMNVDEAIPDTVREELGGLGMLTNLRRANLLGLDLTLPDRI
uniref:ACT domain-containing protein n=1 Tax=Peronospora matthiolae TaxID=2874970 RepID=A0AAV1U462_9STRA